jgi:hypothetical protein
MDREALGQALSLLVGEQDWYVQLSLVALEQSGLDQLGVEVVASRKHSRYWTDMLVKAPAKALRALADEGLGSLSFGSPVVIARGSAADLIDVMLSVDEGVTPQGIDVAIELDCDIEYIAYTSSGADLGENVQRIEQFFNVAALPFGGRPKQIGTGQESNHVEVECASRFLFIQSEHQHIWRLPWSVAKHRSSDPVLSLLLEGREWFVLAAQPAASRVGLERRGCKPLASMQIEKVDWGVFSCPASVLQKIDPWDLCWRRRSHVFFACGPKADSVEAILAATNSFTTEGIVAVIELEPRTAYIWPRLRSLRVHADEAAFSEFVNRAETRLGVSAAPFDWRDWHAI